MRPIQQDDIQDSFNQPKRKFRWIHLPTNKIVRAQTKKLAVKQLKESYNLTVDKSEVRQALMSEPHIL